MNLFRPRLRRVQYTLAALKNKIAERRKRLDDTRSSPDLQAERGLAAAEQFQAMASKSAAWPHRDINTAWTQIHRAQEALVLSKTDTELLLEADDLRREAHTLDRRSKEMLDRWLGSDFAFMPVASKRVRVRRALQVRNEHWDVFYQSAELARGRLNYLGGILAVALIGVLWAATLGGLDETTRTARPGSFVAMIIALGTVGGATSAMIGTVTGSAQRILPIQTRDGPWFLLRPLFGGASALMVFLALSAGLLGVEPNPNGYYALAAVAGFSEGLVVRVASGIAGRTAQEADRERESQAS